MLVDRYGNAFQSLSETEQETGEFWINGKPIYTKIVSVEVNSKTISVTKSLSSLGISNAGHIWVDEQNSYAYYRGDSEGFQSVNAYLSTSDWKASYVNKTNGLSIRGSMPSAMPVTFVVTLRYTKTTD